MKKVKVRKIVASSIESKVRYGITLPKEVLTFFPAGTIISIHRSGAAFLLEKPPEESMDMENYKFEDCRV